MKKSIYQALSFSVIALMVFILSCNRNDEDLEQVRLKATSTVVVRARGTSGSEIIQLQVNNVTVSQWTLTTSMANYTATTTASGNVTVKFTNDATSPQRDVQVDYIQVNGVTRQAEAQVTNTAVYQNGKCGGTLSEMMHCNGYIDFGSLTTTSSFTVSPTSLTVAAAANSTGTFTITSTTSWTVSSSQSWLTVSAASGSSNGSITVTAQQNTGASARTAAVTVTASGTSQTVTVTQSSAGGVSCTVPAMPSYASLTSNAFLPDPFTMMNGTRISTKADWTCRRAEIATQAQEYEYGYYQNTPYAATTGAKSGNSIVVTVNDNGKTISFTCSITYPSTGTAPYPAIIGVGGSNLNNATLSGLGVAVITFPNDQVAQQVDGSSRGKGLFYTLYGSTHSAGAIMAWAWGVGRLIDALEKTPAANIDPSRLGVTGCSRNGKGALACGAFNERIKLTIPQESGSGGAASWRVSDWQGTTVQTLSEIVGENVWFRANFNQFSSTATKLPFDHHMIEALCAPRALLVIENTSMVWLGNISTWTTGNAAHYVWDALGIPDKMGFSQVGHSDHCGFPSAQQPEVTAYVQKFLVGGGSGNTTIMKTDGNLTFDKAKWVNWTVPTLQ